MTGGTLSTTYRGSLGGLLLALLIAVSLAWPLNAAAQPPGALVAIDPPQIAVDPGATFSVTVTIADIAELQSYEFTVQFDPAVVQVEEVERGPFLEGKSPISLGPQIDNEAGTVTFGALAMGSGPWPGGDGQLATLSLRAVARGRTALELRRVSLFDGDGDGDALTVAVEDGTVQVGDAVPTDPPPATPTAPGAIVTPTGTATPTGAATAAPDATATPPGTATATEVVTPGPDATASPTGAATATEMAPVGPDATATADPAPLTETETPAEAADATSTARAGQTPELVEGAPEGTEPGQDVGHDVQPSGPGAGEDAGATTAAGFSPWLIAAVALLILAGLVLIGVGTFATGLFGPEPQPVDDTGHDQTA